MNKYLVRLSPKLEKVNEIRNNEISIGEEKAILDSFQVATNK